MEKKQANEKNNNPTMDPEYLKKRNEEIKPEQPQTIEKGPAPGEESAP